MRDQAAIGVRRTLLRDTLGDVLRRTRLDQGRTLADVSRHARISMPYLSELERGLKEASSEVLAAICEALGIDLAELLAEASRELLDDRAQHTQVIRLGFATGRPPSDIAAPRAPRGHAGSDLTLRMAA